MGATRVAAHAGSAAATVVTTSPTTNPTTTVRGSIAADVLGTSIPTRPRRERMATASPTPTTMPAAPDTSPMHAASARTPPRICRRVAPTARSNATSRRRCATSTLNVFQMTNEPTKSATPANTSRTVVKIPIASRTAAVPSAATCSPVTASAPSGRTPAMVSRSSRALMPSAALTSTSSTTPTLSRKRWAVGRSKPAIVAPSRLSVSPNPTMPTSVNVLRPSTSTTSTLSPSRNPACSAVLASTTTSCRPLGALPSRKDVAPARRGSAVTLVPKVGAPPGWIGFPSASMMRA